MNGFAICVSGDGIGWGRQLFFIMLLLLLHLLSLLGAA